MEWKLNIFARLLVYRIVHNGIVGNRECAEVFSIRTIGRFPNTCVSAHITAERKVNRVFSEWHVLHRPV
jgi:hypothetical protein